MDRIGEVMTGVEISASYSNSMVIYGVRKLSRAEERSFANIYLRKTASLNFRTPTLSALRTYWRRSLGQ